MALHPHVPGTWTTAATVFALALALAAPAWGLQTGVHHDLSPNLFSTWNKIYNEPYSDHTPFAATDFSAYGSNCVMVGAMNPDGVIKLAAFGSAAVIDTVTSLNSPHRTRDVYWYRTNGKSFGFSSSSSISQNSADTASSAAQDRLSWHLGQAHGGYRAGEVTGLNDDHTWRKLIYVAVTSCDNILDDYSVNGNVALRDGFFRDVPTQALLDAGWTTLMDEPYSHSTSLADTDFSSEVGRCIMAGCKATAGSPTLVVAAFIEAAETASTSVKNTPFLHRGVYWYRTPDHSVGFAETSTISQNTADTHNTSSPFRMSWHLSGGGGWRCGGTTGLNSDPNFRKIVMRGPASCADTNALFLVEENNNNDDNNNNGGDNNNGGFLGHDFAPAQGVHYNVLASKFDQWTTVYAHPYNHHTTDSDVDLLGRGYDANACVFVAAKERFADNSFILGAYASVEAVSVVTARNSPNEHRGVWWYNTPGSSFGFAATQDIQQSSADVASSGAQARLSWHIGQGVGGYRAGAVTSLNGNDEYYKYLLVAPVSCDMLGQSGLPQGVQLDVADDFESKGWTRVIDTTYEHGTTNNDVQFVDRGFSGCLFVGAKESSLATTFTLGAFANAALASTTTPNGVPTQSPYGVWWYNTPSKSFGFSGEQSINQNSADVASSNAGSRLSWHIRSTSGVGGYRAGATTGLNDNSQWRKVVWAAPVTCDFVRGDHTFTGGAGGGSNDNGGDNDDNNGDGAAVDPIPFGVFHGLSVSSFRAEDWTTHLDESYAQELTNEQTSLQAYGTRCAFVAAKRTSSSLTYELGAFGTASFISQTTVLNTPNEHRGVLWYRTLGKSFGFVSDGNTISQSSADTESVNAEDRLSWHMGQGVGGYRAGAATGLNNNHNWRKVILVARLSCDAVNADLTLGGGDGGGGGVVRGVPLPEYQQVAMGVVNGVPTSHLAHWEIVYDREYAVTTTYATTTFATFSDRCLFVGCRRSVDSAYRVGAFANADNVGRATSRNSPLKSRGTWWYNTESSSFGFADSSTISQNSADTTDTNSNRRLSWHLSGGGGWRCGDQTGLNSDVAFRKVVLAAPVPCEYVDTQYTWVDGQASFVTVRLSSAGVTPASPSVYGDSFTVTATFSSAATNVTIEDFFLGAAPPSYAGHTLTLEPANGEPTTKALLTVHVSQPSEHAQVYTMQFGNHSGAVSPNTTASNRLEVVHRSPQVTFHSRDFGAVTRDLNVVIIANFTTEVFMPSGEVDAADWGVEMYGVPVPSPVTVAPYGSYSGNGRASAWALTVPLPPTAATMSVSAVHVSVQLPMSYTTPMNWVPTNNNFTLTFVPPTWQWSSRVPAGTQTPFNQITFDLDFSHPMKSVSAEWFALPDLAPMNYFMTITPDVVGYLLNHRNWTVSMKLRSPLRNADVTVAPSFDPTNTITVQYRPPTVTLSTGSPLESGDRMHTVTATFSRPVSGLSESDFSIDAGELGFHTTLAPVNSGGCDFVGCDPDAGASIWTLDFYIDYNIQTSNVSISLPEAPFSISPKTLASNTVSFLFKVVGASITANSNEPVTEPRVAYTVSFDEPVSGLTADDFAIDAGANMYSSTLTVLNARRRMLRAADAGAGRGAAPAAERDGHGRRLLSGTEFLLEVEFVGAFVPAPVQVELVEDAVTPPNAAFPTRTLQGDSQQPVPIIEYAPPRAVVDPASDPGVGVRGPASLNPAPTDVRNVQFTVDFGTPISNLYSHNFQVSCLGGYSQVQVSVSPEMGVEPSQRWIVVLAVDEAQESCFLEVDVVGGFATSPPLATSAQAVYTINYSAPEDGISGGAIAGIVIGVLVALVVVATGIAFALKRRRRQRREGTSVRFGNNSPTRRGSNSSTASAARIVRPRPPTTSPAPAPAPTTHGGAGAGNGKTENEHRPNKATSAVAAGAGANAGAGAGLAYAPPVAPAGQPAYYNATYGLPPPGQGGAVDPYGAIDPYAGLGGNPYSAPPAAYPTAPPYAAVTPYAPTPYAPTPYAPAPTPYAPAPYAPVNPNGRPNSLPPVTVGYVPFNISTSATPPPAATVSYNGKGVSTV